MEPKIRKDFIFKWKKYFKTAELPLVAFYRDDLLDVVVAEKPRGHSCLICDLNKVRKGRSLAFSRESIACGGGRRYSGFQKEVMPDF